MKRIAMIVAIAVLLVPAGLASAKMCKKCQGMMFIMSIGQCSECAGATRSGAHKLCAKCSAKLNKCQACAVSLAAAPTAAPAGKIDLTKSGTYKTGQWEYRLVVTHPGTRSEGRVGTLLHGGKALARAGTNDYYLTPWGKLYWVGHRNAPFGDHGWMPRMKAPAKIGKKLAPPPAVAMQIVRLAESDNGKTRAVTVGQQIIIRLKANATTGHQWSLKGVTGLAVKTEGKVAYEMSASSGGGALGAGGSAVLKLKAVKVGQSVVTLEYRRPSEKDKAPARTFTVTLDVKARAAAVVAAGQGVTGKVIKLKGNFMPGPGAAGGKRIPLSVPVHIFKGKVKPFKTPNRKHAQLVKVVQSGKDGSFKAALPPGVYTVVAEIKGKLHLNIYTVVRPEGMRWGTVTVEKDKWTPFNIDDASEAAY